MKNLLLYVSMLIFTSIGTLSAQTYSGGAGTAENPYQISTLGDLRYLSENGEADWDKHFIMTNDIDASDTRNWNGGAGFLPIGKDENSPFIGTFDGGGFAIDSLLINSGRAYVGFFGFVGESDFEIAISNLEIRECVIIGNGEYPISGGLIAVNYSCINNCNVSGNVSSNGSENFDVDMDKYSKSVSGGLIGKNYNKVKNCRAIAIVTSSALMLSVSGGLIGINNDALIMNCYAEAEVKSISLWEDYSFSGGLIGVSEKGDISYCHAEATVNALAEKYSVSYSGGLVGRNGSLVNNCYSMGDCIASDGHNFETYSVVGGFIGENGGNINNCYSRVNVTLDCGYAIPSGAGGFIGGNEGIINNCYCASSITSNIENYVVITVGGLIGGEFYWSGGNINDCFWDIDIANISESVSATPKSTAEMKDINTFLNANWNFESIWSINDTINDGYSYLQENPVGIAETELSNIPLQIYPNPATNQININHENIINKIEIYDITGQLIITANTLQIDVSNLSNGIYQVVLRSGNKIETSQLIIMR